jgi:hypothetical protein
MPDAAQAVYRLPLGFSWIKPGFSSFDVFSFSFSTPHQRFAYARLLGLHLIPFSETFSLMLTTSPLRGTQLKVAWSLPL